MDLDINTPLGQLSLADENRMLCAIENKYPYRVIQTPKHREAKVDGFFEIDGEVRAIFESKCRYNMEFDVNTNQLSCEGRDIDTWLITYDKILQGHKLSKLLCVPFIGLLYIVPSDIVLCWKITNEFGTIQVETNARVSDTQFTINGGSTSRMNAYLELSESEVFISPSELVVTNN